MSVNEPISPVVNQQADNNQQLPLVPQAHEAVNNQNVVQPQQPVQPVVVGQQPIKVDLIEYPGRGFTLPTWIIYCKNEFSQYLNLTESNKINAAIRMLRDDELFNWANLWNSDNPNSTFNDFAAALIELKRDANNDSRVLNELRNMRLDFSKPNAIDSLVDYTNRFRSLVSKLYDTQHVGQLITAAYINNIPETLKAIIRIYVPKNEHELYTITDPTRLYNLVQQHAGEYAASYKIDRSENLRRIIKESNKRQRNPNQNQQHQSHKAVKLEQQTTTSSNAVSTDSNNNRPAKLSDTDWAVVREYCKKHNLCYRCKQQYHGAGRKNKCQHPYVHWTAEHVNNLNQQRQ